MLMRSISSGSIAATCQATAAAVMSSNNRSRWAAVSTLESATPGTWRAGSSTTAPATTGPARQPRPTSSAPATCTYPRRRISFSTVRDARERDMAAPQDQRPQEASRRALLFLHPGGLAAQIAEERQLGAPHAGAAHHFDLVHRRRVQREDALDAL